MSDEEESSRAQELRFAAETRLKRAESEAEPAHDDLDIHTSRYVYELQVHQIELQMQNEELRHARGEVNAALARFKSLFDDAPVGYMTLDRLGTMREVNLTAARLLGLDRSWLVHRRFALFLDLADRTMFADLLDQVFAGTPNLTGDVSLVAQPRGRVVLRLAAMAVTNADANESECRITMTDITVQKRAEWSRDMHTAAFNATTNAIFITDPKGVIETVNETFTTLTGYALHEAVGRTPGDLLKSGEHDSRFYHDMWRTILDGKVWSRETTNRRKNGSHFVVELTVIPVRDTSGAITHFVAVSRDLTEVRLQSQRLMQAQRMETVGRLAGGIAHDFNNLLTVINGTASVAQRELSAGDPIRQDLREIEQAGKRAAQLTRQLLAFSRKQIMSFERLDLSAMLHGMRGVVRRLFGPDVTVSLSAPKDVGHVRADPAQLEQVILNLVLNARDAMPAGGTLGINVRDRELDEDFAATHPGVVAGSYVELSVADTGAGMSTETAARIFEPFFTTKAMGDGTGLGLAMVYGIVKQSGGCVFVESELGHGSTFTIFLPRVEHLDPGDVTDETPPLPRSDRGNESILIVEDEPAILRLAERLLRVAGYHVLTASSGAEALVLLADEALEIELMLTDMVMPGMSGWELAVQAKRLRPHVCCIFTSGYTDSLSLPVSLEAGFANFIAKPYTASQLTRIVRDVLDGVVSPPIVTRASGAVARPLDAPAPPPKS